MYTFNDTVRVGRNDYAIELSIDDAGVIVRACAPTLDRLHKDTLPELMKAIKKVEDGSKRGFKNPTAYMLQHGFGNAEKVVEVEVTSIRDDKTAWVRYKEKKQYGSTRGTESLSRLYKRREQLEVMIQEQKRLETTVRKMWESVDLWTPEFLDEKEKKA